MVEFDSTCFLNTYYALKTGLGSVADTIMRNIQLCPSGHTCCGDMLEGKKKCQGPQQLIHIVEIFPGQGFPSQAL